jgi:hypothetical protein
MVKKSASFVLASLRDSTYGSKYALPLRSLRPRWTAFLTILRALYAFGGLGSGFSASRLVSI